MRILNFFYKSSSKEDTTTLSSLTSNTESAKAMQLMKDFIASKKTITRDEADKIKKSVQRYNPQSQNSLIKKINSIALFIFPKFLPKIEKLKNEVISICSDIVTRDTQIERQVSSFLEATEESSEGSLEAFKKKVSPFLSLPPLKKALFTKTLAESIIKKLPSNEGAKYLKELFPLIDSIKNDFTESPELKKDPLLESTFEILSEFKNNIDSILQNKNGPLPLNILSCLYFVKNLLQEDKVTISENKDNHFKFLGSESLPLENQITLFNQVKKFDRENDPDLYYKGKLLLNHAKYFPNQIVIEEGSNYLKKSRNFSSVLLNSIQQSIDNKSNNNILQDIEILLEQEPNSLSSLNLESIKDYLKNIDFNTNPQILLMLLKIELKGKYSASFINVICKIALKVKDINSNKLNLLIDSEGMIFIEFDKKTKDLKIKFGKFIAKGELGNVFDFENSQVIKIPKSLDIDQINAFASHYTKLYEANPGGILKPTKVELSAIGTFTGNDCQYEYDKEGKNNFTFLVIEKCNGKFIDPTLTIDNQNVKDFSEKVKGFSKNLASSLRSAHDLGVPHGDIKPANILSNNNRAYLIDWDSTVELNNLDELPTSFDYSGEYAISEEADECYKKVMDFNKDKSPAIKAEYINLRKKMDIFSLGITFYQLALNDSKLFPYKSEIKYGKPILNKPKESFTDLEALKKVYTSNQSDLILKMLDPEPNNRPTANEVAEAFS